MVIVLMGVAGSGKTTVGQVLAQRLGWPFRDADDFHPEANREKMRRGIPLNDDDRRPWLAAIRMAIVQCLRTRENAIFACSALKQSYREILQVYADKVRFVFLCGSEELIAARLRNRRGHFFDPALLHTQFEDLEEPQDVIKIDVSASPETIADAIMEALQL